MSGVSVVFIDYKCSPFVLRMQLTQANKKANAIAFAFGKLIFRKG